MTDPNKQQTYSSDVPLPVELSPWLLLSDLSSVMSLDKLKELNVTHVLSVHSYNPDAERWFQGVLKGTGIARKFIRCEDEEGYDMIGKHWAECLEFLTNAKTTNGRVVVHCMAGINRSGLIASAALMCLERKPVLEVVRHCKERRNTYLWNYSFQRQLCELAQQECWVPNRKGTMMSHAFSRNLLRLRQKMPSCA